MRLLRLLQAAVLLSSLPLSALAQTSSLPQSVAAEDTSDIASREIDRDLVRELSNMMGAIRGESRSDARTIKDVYGPLVKSATFDTRDDLRRAYDTGTLVPLLDHPNLQPRLTGRSPIAERDLEHQPLYVGARPAAMGMLLEIARRLEEGPIEITSLVRSQDYQRALLSRNANAGTDVPTHAMGYAVDIGVMFTPIDTANALRRVLESMRDRGDIYFIGEARQLTFHVVPTLVRRGYFEEVYETARLGEEARERYGAPVSATHSFEPGPVPPPPISKPTGFARFLTWVANLFA